MPEALLSTWMPASPAIERQLCGARIASVGAALPPTVRTNASFSKRLGLSESWIVERMGVRERRIAGPGDRLSDLAAEAGRLALERAGLEPAAVDLVLVASSSQDELMPNAAPLVAQELGALSAGAMDIGAACSGFLSALALAVGQIEAGRAANVLAVGADFSSRFVDPDDPRTGPLFGDGAGAVVVTGSTPPGHVGPILMWADGSRSDSVFAPRGGTIRMDGHDTFKQAANRLAAVTAEAVGAAGTSLEEIDVFVYHQANSRILRAVGERLGLSPERVVDCLDRYGNTSGASIPIALAEAEAAGMLEPGTRVLIGAFGAGLTWGATVVEWDHDA